MEGVEVEESVGKRYGVGVERGDQEVQAGKEGAREQVGVWLIATV